MLPSTKASVARKRPYTRAFSPPDPKNFKRYLLDKIPPRLWIRVEAKANREHKSVRQVILELLTQWLQQGAPHGPSDPGHPEFPQKDQS